MYLKNLEITGFKSFADKINIDFPYNFTGVVGPNGSGKSNILDAIRFVLGEQSSKNLRGSKMDDVIFMGSNTKKPQSFCKVTLTLDNSQKMLNSEFDELSITRKIYKSGESEYILNGKDVRLRDVSALLMDTGLSRDGYSIISQGKIDNILSQKSSDRREFFDEATGITKFKHKKIESERQIEKTDENILRLMDILGEKEKRIAPLEEQAKKATTYLELAEKLKENEIYMHKMDILSFEDTIKVAKNDLDKCKDEIYDIKISYNQKNLDINKINIAVKKIDEEIEQINAKSLQKYNDFMENKNKLKTYEINVEYANNDIKRINDEILEILNEISSTKEKIKNSENEISYRKSMLEGFEKDRIALIDKKHEISAEIAENTEIKDKIIAKKREISNEIYQIDMNIKKEQSELAFFENMNDSFEGLPRAVSSVLRNYKLHGIHNTVGNVLEVSEKYILAINSALGGVINNIIVDSSDDAISAISFLKEQKLGVCTFLPIDKIRGKDEPKIAGNFSGFLGFANTLVKCEFCYNNIINSFLSSIIICDNAQNAKNIASKLNYKIVTLDGEVFYKGGAISGGFFKKTTSTLMNKKKIYEIEHKIEQFNVKKTKLNSEIQKLDKMYENYDFEWVFAELNEQIVQNNAEFEKINSSIYKEQSFIDNFSSDYFENEIAVKNVRITHKKAQIHNINAKIVEYSEKIIVINKEIKSYDENKFKQKIKEFNLLKEKNQGEIAKINAEINILTEKRIELEKNLVNFENKIDNLYNKQNDVLSKLWEKYNLTYSQVIELPESSEKYEVLYQNVASFSRKINNLGNVNLDAPEEYRVLKEEYDFLKNQISDLETSRREIEKVLERLTDNMQDVFQKEFAQLNQTFSEVFCDLFAGGSGYLELSDPLNILDSGIEIKVNPPGKSLKSLSLLSGGERAFVAIAILFAILKCRKTPFCVLDEIDSALDDINVHKFANYLKNHFGDTQFIVITHRKGTMEYADILYGVTMEQKGVSKMLKMNLNK